MDRRIKLQCNLNEKIDTTNMDTIKDISNALRNELIDVLEDKEKEIDRLKQEIKQLNSQINKNKPLPNPTPKNLKMDLRDI